MKTWIIYYSRTGTSRRIAQRLGEELQAEVVEILDACRYRGFLGYLRAGFVASGWRKVSYRLSRPVEIDAETQVYLVSPVWAGRCAAAVYSMLMDHSIEKKSLVLTNNGTDPEKAYCRIEEKFGFFEHKYCIRRSLGNEEEILRQVVKDAGC